MTTGSTHDPTRSSGPVLSRRWVLGAGAATVLLAACGESGGSDASGTTTTAAGPATTEGTVAPTTTAAEATPTALAALTAADFAALSTCSLLPEQTSGPFPLDEQFDRRDITEGYLGHPMRLGFRVVDPACTPIPGATVEIWHTDATGDYSAYTDGGGGKDEAEGTTFMRGTQPANDDGIVEFQTIVPGWYTGRAVHIHLRVHIDDTTVLTSQVFFDPAFLSETYAAEPYAEFGEPDTSLEEDGIAGDAEGDGTILHTSAAETYAGSGTLALLNLGVDRDAESSEGGGGGMPGGSPPGA